jgi:predicted Zn-dependent protease
MIQVLRRAVADDPGQRFPSLADMERTHIERVLREAMKTAPDDAGLMHALGLLLVREKKVDEALILLKGAAERAPGNARYAYVYGVALNTTGQTSKAIAVLESTQKRHPYDRDLLYALATINRDAGRLDVARRYTEELAAVAPNDPEVQSLLRNLER